MKTRDIVITAPQFEELREHLLRRPDREQLALLIVGPAIGYDRVRLLVRDVVPLPDHAFESQGATALVPRMDAVLPLVERCSREGLGMIEAHSHPFDKGSATTFSSIDINNMWAKYPFLDEVLGGAPIGALVFGQETFDGMLWIPQEQCLAPIHSVKVLGWPLRQVPTTFARAHLRPASQAPIDDAFDRQVRAFGRPGQDRMSLLRVGIVGLGGIGSLLVEPLCRLGVRDFVLVDPDVIERTNLNRLAGAREADVTNAVPKVNLAARVAGSLGWTAHVKPLHGRLENPAVQAELKTVDVIFGGLDSHGARLTLNKFAAQYLIPYVDCGTGITLDEGSISAIGGQVRVVLPCNPCLRCMGAIDLKRASIDLMDEIERDRHRRRGYVDDADTPAPSVMPLNMYAAAVALDEFLGLVTGYKSFTPLVAFDLITRNATAVDVTPQTDCVACGPHSSKGRGDAEPIAQRSVDSATERAFKSMRDGGALIEPNL